MSETSMKGCPFCKGHNLGYKRLYQPLPDFEDKGSTWLVMCRDCNIQFFFAEICSEEELREKWNRRPDK